MLTRRYLLQTGAATVGLMAMAPLSGCSALKDPASAAWRSVGEGFTDPRLNALSWAVLAPSPHNRQPWLIDVSDPDNLTVYPDLTRLLPQTDPQHRQIVLGLGAFVEAFVLAASSLGRSVAVEAFPGGEDPAGLDARPFARLRMGAHRTATADPLFDWLPTRRTNRSVFDARAVPTDVLHRLGLGTVSTWGTTTNADHVVRLRDIAQQGWTIESETPRTHAESVRLTRIGPAEIAANPDGISLSGPAVRAAKAVGVLNRKAMLKPDSRAFALMQDGYADMIDSAPSFGWLISAGNSRAAQLQAGRDWMRVHLNATREGVAFHPLSQALQEFDEMKAPFAALHDDLGVTAPDRVQGLFRLGYAKAPPPSPRWPLRSRLIEAAP